VVGMYDQTAGYVHQSPDDFLERLSQTSDTPGKPFHMPNGTPFFCTAGGTLLKNGLADWNKLPRSQRDPGAVKVAKQVEDPALVKKQNRLTRPPANALIVRTYVRGLKQGTDGKLFAPRIINWEYNLRLRAEPNRDFLWLQEHEWQSLVPAQGVNGHTFLVPEAVRDRICHWHIAGGYHTLPGFYMSEDFRSKGMTLTVEEVTPQAVSLRLVGLASLKSGASYRFRGLLKYEVKKKTFTRFDIIALCDAGSDPKPNGHNIAPFRYYGIAFELAGNRTDDLLPPFYLRGDFGTPQRYFANRR